VPVTVEADGIGRFPQDIEAAVYFCCLEALQNTIKYAYASSARICLQVQNGTLRFTVSDDGAGYDTSHTPPGSGQRNMADRLAALGGRLEVWSALAQGTTITGNLPVPLSCPSWDRLMRCATSVPEVACQHGQSRTLTRHPRNPRAAKAQLLGVVATT
jgi:signal transduction histidine kinase